MTAPARIGRFPAWTLSALRDPTVVVDLLLAIHFTAGTERYHPGYGEISAGGETWFGVTDPSAARVVTVSGIEEGRSGVATLTDVSMTNVSLSFLNLIRVKAEPLRNKRCDLLLALFDRTTFEAMGPPIPLVDAGRITGPKYVQDTKETGTLSFSIEGYWVARNVATAGKWSGPDQRLRSPGDAACDQTGRTLRWRWPN